MTQKTEATMRETPRTPIVCVNEAQVEWVGWLRFRGCSSGVAIFRSRYGTRQGLQVGTLVKLGFPSVDPD